MDLGSSWIGSAEILPPSLIIIWEQRLFRCCHRQVNWISALKNIVTFLQDKETTDFEPNCLFKVDEFGFFIYWKSEGRVSELIPHMLIIYFNWMKINVILFEIESATHFLMILSRKLIKANLIRFIKCSLSNKLVIRVAIINKRL